MNQQARRLATMVLIAVFCLTGVSWAQTERASPRSVCKAPKSLDLFAAAIRRFMRARSRGQEWRVFQVPCDTPREIDHFLVVRDHPPFAILVVDPGIVNETELLDYHFEQLSPSASGGPRKSDNLLVRFVDMFLRPDLDRVPSVWTSPRGALTGEQLQTLRSAVAAGAIQALAGLKRADLCSPEGLFKPLLEVAATPSEDTSAAKADPYFGAALDEYQLMIRKIKAVPPSAEVIRDSLKKVLSTPPYNGGSCKVGNRAAFPKWGRSQTLLSQAARHIDAALKELISETETVDTAELSQAMVCTFEAVDEMLSKQNPVSCSSTDNNYGLWVGAYAPLLHAAEVHVLSQSAVR